MDALQIISLIIGIIIGSTTIAGTIWGTWKVTMRQQKQQTEALSMAIYNVIETAVRDEKRHETHERRLDSAEKSDRELKEIMNSRFNKIDELFNRTDERLQKITDHLINK